MEPDRSEYQKQRVFETFCKQVLRNEAADAHEEIKRHRAKEVSFSPPLFWERKIDPRICLKA